MADEKAPNVPAPQVPHDPNINPATLNPLGTSAPIHAPDAHSNPAATGAKMGGTQAPNPAPGTVQTTIDSKTTTVHADATVHNRVEPDGGPVAKKGEKK